MNTEKQLENKGTLVYQNENVAVNANYASRYSLYINFLEKSPLLNDTQTGEIKPSINQQQDRRFKFITDTYFDSLKLELNGSTFEFGKCKFISNRENPQFNGKLFFTEDVYDMFEVFSTNRLVNLNDHFKNVAAIMPQKKHIHQTFRDYTSNLTYDLNVYKGLFDDLDAKYIGEDPVIRNVVQNIIIKNEGKAFMKFFDEKLHELENIITLFSEEDNAIHGYYFRKQLWDIILMSAFMKRTNLKPRGYAGDSEMMSMIYENGYRGETTFSKILHKHTLETAAAQAVRNRVKIIGDVISDVKKNSQKTGEVFKILSLACGPAREIENIITKKEDCSAYHFTLFDQDMEAIEEAKQNIAKVNHQYDIKLNYDVIKDSIRTIISMPNLPEKWGTFHFIYALGLFDYLADRVAQAVIPKLYSLLKPGGQMLIGNYHVSNPTRYYMAYWLDWLLYYRTEEDMIRLTENLANAKKEVFFDDSKSQMFLRITRLE